LNLEITALEAQKIAAEKEATRLEEAKENSAKL
jgi:hypothetical protein